VIWKNNLFYSIVTALLLCINFSIGQGVLLKSEIVSSFELDPINLEIGAKGVSSKLPFSKSLKLYCPRPAKQGNIQACTSFSLSYGAMTILSAIESKQTNNSNITKEAFSPFFGYLISKPVNICEPIDIGLVANSIKKLGNLKVDDYNFDYNCNSLVNSSYFELSAKYRIKNVFRLYSKNQDSPSDPTIHIKTSLVKENPVVVVLNLDLNKFSSLNSYNYLYIPPTEKSELKGHAVTIIAYHDQDSTFEILNSYGTEWGNKGFFTIKYTDLAKICTYAITIALRKHNDFIAELSFEKGPSQSARKPVYIKLDPTNLKHIFTATADTVYPVLQYYSAKSYVWAYVVNKTSVMELTSSKDQHSTYLDFIRKDAVEFEKGDLLVIIVSKSDLSKTYFPILYKTAKPENIFKRLNIKPENYKTSLSNVIKLSTIEMEEEKKGSTKILCTIIKFI